MVRSVAESPMKEAEMLAIHRTALALRALGDAQSGGRLVLVSSARAGEGKSFVASLLARALAAQQEGEILLVEAGPGGEPDPLGGGAGLRGLLDGVPSGEVIKPAGEAPGLWRLPRGDGYDNGHLFRAAHWRAALQPLRARFAVIVIDGPALAASGALLGLSDRSVLVVDSSRTPGPQVRDALDSALAMARLPRDHVAGVVLNRRPTGLPRWLAG